MVEIPSALEVWQQQNTINMGGVLRCSARRPVLAHAYRLCHALFRHLSRSRRSLLLESAMASSSFESLTVEEFGSFLSDKNVDEEVIDNFKRNKVSGAAFLMLTERDINELVPSVGLRQPFSRTATRYRYT